MYLFHVLPPIPPRLLEFRGAENPQKEHMLSAEFRTAQAEWLEKSEDSARILIKGAQTILGDYGVL
jgi:hypothetical protein